MKKFVLFIFSLMIIILSLMIIYQNQKHKASNHGVANPNLAIMIQNENDDDYHKSEDNVWPSFDEYELNPSLGDCSNMISLDAEQNTIDLKTNHSQKCTIYFDKKADEPLEITGIDYETNYKMGNNDKVESTIDFTINVKGGKAPYQYSYEGTYTCFNAENLQDYYVASNDNTFSFKLPFYSAHTYTLTFTVTDANNETASYYYNISPEGCFNVYFSQGCAICLLI